MSRKFKKQWWETTFDGKYLKTYIDTVTPELTTQQIAFLLDKLKLQKGMEILDLACGYGRHAIGLAKLGFKVIGLDFSKYLVKLAQKEAKEKNVKIIFVQDDMRNLSFVNRFDVILSMFTSFGYFENDDDNIRVLQKINHALKVGGVFLLDVNNTARVLVHMAQTGKIDKKNGFLTMINTNKLSNGFVVERKDEFNPETMRWSMTRTWKENGKLRSYKTNVRMFFLPELKYLLEKNGLHVEKVWGDFQGASLDLETRRMIILARKV